MKIEIFKNDNLFFCQEVINVEITEYSDNYSVEIDQESEDKSYNIHAEFTLRNKKDYKINIS